MKRLSSCLVLFAVAVTSSPAVADDAPYRIYAGHDYRGYTNAELQRRVFELERAVMQLQQRVYNLEAAPPPPPVVVQPRVMPWTCTVSAFSQNYVQTAESRGQAEALVKQQCAAASHEMHCRNVRCSQ